MRRSLKRLVSLALCTALIAAAIPTATSFAAAGPGNDNTDAAIESADETQAEAGTAEEAGGETVQTSETVESTETTEASESSAESVTITPSSDGIVAMIGETGYPSVQDAVNAAKDVDTEKGEVPDTIVMVADSVEDVTNNKKTITLDLNGHTLKGSGTTSVIKSSGKLTIDDSGGTGKITGGNATEGGGIHSTGDLVINGGNITGNRATDGGGIYNNSALIINDGNITGNRAINGGGIYCGYGSGDVSWRPIATLKIYGGKISDNTATSCGGGVCNSGFQMELFDGEIRDNSAVYGGGVYNCIYFYMYGGSIAGNFASADGGGVHNEQYQEYLHPGDKWWDSRMTMTGGLIADNAAGEDGGGICFSVCEVDLEGGTITRNKAARGGGVSYPVLVEWEEIDIDGTAIYGNTATSEGTDIYKTFCVGLYLALPSHMDFGGYTAIGIYDDWKSGRYADTDDPKGYLEDTGFGCAIWYDRYGEGPDELEYEGDYCLIIAYGCNVTLDANDGSGRKDEQFVNITKNENVVLPEAEKFYGKSVDRDNCFTWNTKADGTGTTYLPGDIPDLKTLGGDITFYAQYDHDWVRSTETVSGVEYTVDTCSKCGQVIRTASMSSELSEVISADYTMTNDITLSSSFVIPKNTEVILDLNGHTLKGSGNGSVIINNGTLTVTDSSESGTGLITGGVSRHGGGIDSSGDLTIKGGTISGNKATLSMARSASSLNTALTVDGGGIYSSGSLTIDGGTVSGNSAESGGGIYNAGSFTMNGGSITGNTAKAESAASSVTGYGGGIYLSEAGHTFTMNGGSIKDNTAGGNGGGVYAAKAIVMNGGDIRDNTATEGGGVYLTQNINLTMNDGVISGNSAESGGGIRFENTDSTVKGSVFANTAEKQGADIYLALSQSTDDPSNLRLYFSANMGDEAYRIGGWYYDKAGARYADSGNTTQVTFTDGEAVISTKTRAETYSLISAYSAK